MKIRKLFGSLYVRFALIFIGAFLVFIFILNSRFLGANIEYILNPPVKGNPSPFPLAENLLDTPLPNQATLVIDNIRARAPIIFNTSTTSVGNKDIYKQLENGVVHYSTTPKPGERGTAVILGHSSAYPWYRGDYGSVFALLSKLAPGERFQVNYSDGRIFTFEVKQSLVFNPLEDDSRLTAMEQSSRPSIILVSCWPVGTDYRRLAVRAELVE